MSAIEPPSEWPTRTGSAASSWGSSAGSTSSASSWKNAGVRGRGGGSERPWPKRENAMTRRPVASFRAAGKPRHSPTDPRPSWSSTSGRRAVSPGSSTASMRRLSTVADMAAHTLGSARPEGGVAHDVAGRPCRDRRRLGGMRGRGPAGGAGRRARRRPRGGRAGHAGGDPPAADVAGALGHRGRLGVRDDAAGAQRRARAPVAARQGARRLELAQRHGVPARQPGRLRRLGLPRLQGLGLRRAAAAVPADGGRARRRPALPRPRRPEHAAPGARPEPDLRGVRRGRAREGPPGHRRPQRRAVRGRRLPRHDHHGRPAPERGRRLPAPRRRPAKPRDRHRRASARAAVRRRPLRRRALRAGWRGGRAARRRRGRRVRRRGGLPGAAPALRDRAGGRAPGPRYRRRRRRAGRRAQPPRPPPDGRLLGGGAGGSAARVQHVRVVDVHPQRPGPAGAGPALHVHPRAVPPADLHGARGRVDDRGRPRAPGEPRRPHAPLGRPERQAADRPGVPHRGGRRRRDGARRRDRPRPRDGARVRVVARPRGASRRRRPRHRGAARLRPPRGRELLPPGRDVQDGRRPRRGRRPRAARARHRRPARRRRLDHAERRVRQHERGGDDDRREGGRPPARGASGGDAGGGRGGRRLSGLTRLGAIRWTNSVPALAAVALALTWGTKPGTAVLVVVAVLLAGSVLAAVHHAEVVAHRVGEPFGSLILAVAVTVIEVGLIVTLMASGGDDASTLARDTVFAAAMITCNGIVGLALLVAALREHVVPFRAEATTAALSTVATLATLTLVLPTFTTSTPGPEFSTSQLAFAAVASLTLYLLFVFVQTVRHRDYFLPETAPGDPDAHAEPPSERQTLQSLAVLVVALVAVVGLAKIESKPIEDAVDAVGAPQSAVGVVIALLVLMPETLAAYRNAARGRVQISLNLAYGSAMASIGLTIPAIAIASIWLEPPLELGLGPTQIVLLTITVIAGALSAPLGRTTVQQSGIRLVLFAAFLFLAVFP